jgi:hypothetical protein
MVAIDWKRPVCGGDQCPTVISPGMKDRPTCHLALGHRERSSHYISCSLFYELMVISNIACSRETFGTPEARRGAKDSVQLQDISTEYNLDRNS